MLRITLTRGPGSRGLLPPAETPLERGDLWRAQGAFLSNSLIDLRPLAEVGGKTLGNGRPGPVTERLREAYEKTLP